MSQPVEDDENDAFSESDGENEAAYIRNARTGLGGEGPDTRSEEQVLANVAVGVHSMGEMAANITGDLQEQSQQRNQQEAQRRAAKAKAAAAAEAKRLEKQAQAQRLREQQKEAAVQRLNQDAARAGQLARDTSALRSVAVDLAVRSPEQADGVVRQLDDVAADVADARDELSGRLQATIRRHNGGDGIARVDVRELSAAAESMHSQQSAGANTRVSFWSKLSKALTCGGCEVRVDRARRLGRR